MPIFVLWNSCTNLVLWKKKTSVAGTDPDNSSGKGESATWVSIGGSKGSARDFPPGVQIISFSCSFCQTNWKIIALWELAHLPRENPGSATGINSILPVMHPKLQEIEEI